MLPVLHRGGRGGLVGRTQRDGLAPLACLQSQAAARQAADRIRQDYKARQGGGGSRLVSHVDTTRRPDKCEADSAAAFQSEHERGFKEDTLRRAS